MSNERYTNMAHAPAVIGYILDEAISGWSYEEGAPFIGVLTLVQCGMFSTASEYLESLQGLTERQTVARDAIVERLNVMDAFKEG